MCASTEMIIDVIMS